MMKNIWMEEEGQGMVEYGLILALVSIVAIGALSLLGGQVKEKFQTIDTELSNTQRDVTP